MTWRAGILSVATVFGSRIEVCLPPEHRVRATREDRDMDVIEMVIVGPMMPLLGDGEVPGRVHMVMEMCTPNDDAWPGLEDEPWKLNARFEQGDFRCHKTLGEWNIASFPTFEGFQRFMERCRDDAG